MAPDFRRAIDSADRLGHVDHAHQIGIDHCPDVVVQDHPNRAFFEDPGIVHENVDPSESVEGCLCKRRWPLWRSDIGSNRYNLPLRPFPHRFGCFGELDAVPPIDHEMRASVGKTYRCGEPDASRRAGNNRHPICEIN